MRFFAWVASLFLFSSKQQEEEKEERQEQKSDEQKWRDDLYKMMGLEALIKRGQLPADDCPTELLIKLYMNTNVCEREVEILVIRLLKARPDCTARQLLKIKAWTPGASVEVHEAIEDALNTRARAKELKEMISEEQ